MGKNNSFQLCIDHDKDLSEPVAIAKSFIDAEPGSLQDAGARAVSKVAHREQIATGDKFTFLYNEDDDVMFGCGANSYGQLGAGQAMKILSQVPTRIGPLSARKVVKMACGCSFSWFITKNDEVLSTGSNGYGKYRSRF